MTRAQADVAYLVVSYGLALVGLAMCAAEVMAQ
jgi:hypothetical protein